MNNPLNNALKTIIKIAKPDKVILFGSQVQNTSNPSGDYDFLVLKKGIKHPRKLAQKIYLNFNNIGAPVDIIIADLDKYKNLKNDPYMIYMEADKHGKIIYEKQP